MSDVTIVQKLIAPMPGAIVRTMKAASAVNVGDEVISTSTGVAQSDASLGATSVGIGIVTAVGTDGGLTAAANDAVSVVVFGPVSGFSGLTPGAPGYTSDTAGKIGDAVGTKTFVLGRCETSEVFFVNPTVTTISDE